jgi:Fic family protein
VYSLQPGGYRAFLPKGLPPEGLDLDARLQALLSRADRELGRLDGVIGVIPDPDLFVLQFVRREAVLSSQIEGTHASLVDVLEYEALLHKGSATVDIAEIVNYVAAMNRGLGLLGTLPLSRRLICEVHGVLMRETRGGEPHKTPGEFRRSQNWIGGASPATARFVPPPHDQVPDLFADLERYLHDPAPVPPLIKAGVAHAQFETIHPFLDGNGRVGRLLITFWLVEQGILRKPVLYPSLFFKRNRDEYVARLQAVRDEGDWEGWLAFFVDGVGKTAREATDTAHAILQLRERDRARIHEHVGRGSPNALALLDVLLKQPIVSARFVEDALEVSQPTASGLVRKLAELDMLVEITGRKRHRVFAYRDYLALFPGAEDRD